METNRKHFKNYSKQNNTLYFVRDRRMFTFHKLVWFKPVCHDWIDKLMASMKWGLNQNGLLSPWRIRAHHASTFKRLWILLHIIFTEISLLFAVAPGTKYLVQYNHVLLGKIDAHVNVLERCLNELQWKLLKVVSIIFFKFNSKNILFYKRTAHLMIPFFLFTQIFLFLK